MTSPAVRVGDLGSHGNVMQTGSTNVMVNDRQAHRQFDLFICPIHGAGVTLLNCSTKLLINGQCAVHLNSIGQDEYPAMNIQGSQNVMYGEA